MKEKTTYYVNRRSAGGAKQILFAAASEEDAFQFCSEHDWELKDENGFVWELGVEYKTVREETEDPHPSAEDDKKEQKKESKKLLKVTDIQWDADPEDIEALPKEAVLPERLMLELTAGPESVDAGYFEEVCDWLSDTYGYCVFSFSVLTLGGEKNAERDTREDPNKQDTGKGTDPDETSLLMLGAMEWERAGYNLAALYEKAYEGVSIHDLKAMCEDWIRTYQSEPVFIAAPERFFSEKIHRFLLEKTHPQEFCDSVHKKIRICRLLMSAQDGLTGVFRDADTILEDLRDEALDTGREGIYGLAEKTKNIYNNSTDKKSVEEMVSILYAGSDDISGISKEVFAVWENTGDKASVEKVFQKILGVSFEEYLNECILYTTRAEIKGENEKC